MTYCAHCFETFSASETRPGFTEILECVQCGRQYHAAHYTGKCECGSGDARKINLDEALRLSPVSPPVSLNPKDGKTTHESAAQARVLPSRPSGKVTKSTTPIVEPVHSGVVDTTKREESPPPPPPKRTADWIRYVVGRVSSFLLGLLFVGIATLVGAYVPKALEARPITVENVLNQVTRTGVPPAVYFIMAFVGAAAFALLFYHHTEPHRRNTLTWRLLTGVIGVLVCLMIFNSLTLGDILRFGIADALASIEPTMVICMGAGALVASAFALLHIQLSTKPMPPALLESTLPLRLWSHVRFVVVGLSLAFSAFLFAHYNMAGWPGRDMSITVAAWRNLFGEAQLLAAFLTAIGVGAIVYWPTEDSFVKNRYLGVRVMIVILVVGLLLFLYSGATGSARDFLNAVGLTAATTCLFVPVQRLYA